MSSGPAPLDTSATITSTVASINLEVAQELNANISSLRFVLRLIPYIPQSLLFATLHSLPLSLLSRLHQSQALDARMIGLSFAPVPRQTASPEHFCSTGTIVILGALVLSSASREMTSRTTFVPLEQS